MTSGFRKLLEDSRYSSSPNDTRTESFPCPTPSIISETSIHEGWIWTEQIFRPAQDGIHSGETKHIDAAMIWGCPVNCLVTNKKAHYLGTVVMSMIWGHHSLWTVRTWQAYGANLDAIFDSIFQAIHVGWDYCTWSHWLVHPTMALTQTSVPIRVRPCRLPRSKMTRLFWKKQIMNHQK